MEVEGAPPTSTPPAGTAAPAPGVDGAAGGLPVTGTRTALAAATGAVAVAVGAALFLLGRRRRIRLEPPTR